ncbi:nuclear pore complex protein Nup133 [Pectinophora gossypiella]|uniref:nuclear pore complex protein Nup133 n=1 Tax=Pectinophora gossypiella TaxID=13191 RepID=UPI00214EFC26|nr:nuclear pore complex protein Nup133 [Pectinophora gossypiella]
MDFNTSGTMRSPFSPRVRQSITGRRPIGLSSAKKPQSKFIQSTEPQNGDVIYKTPLTTVETYGTPLPVMVTEALTFASGEVTVRLSPCGWCWLVTGRRILAWPREVLAPSGAASPAPAGTVAARELTLPQTDLAHKADLVTLFYEDGAQMPSCIGVSPEGIVRYWPSVGQEGVYVDVSAELAGQECERLGDYTRAGIVLATTTCTVVLLDPTVVDGRATVTCHTLRPPSGWLGGIGRRVSLLFFGSMPAHADTKLVGVVVLSDGLLTENGGARLALVAGGGGVGAGGPLLQLWWGAELHTHALRRALADAHAIKHLQPQGDLNSLEIIALDVRASGSDGLLLLIAAFNVARSPEMRYAIAHISVEDPANPRVTSLVGVRGGARAGEVDDPPRLLPLAARALLYTNKYIAVVATTVSNDKADYIDVSSEGDKILGAELCNGVPLLFSKKHGVLALYTADSLAPTPSVCDSPMGSPCPSDMYDGNLSLYEIDPHEVSMVTTDACGKLKTAFLFHLRRDTVACRAIVDELFPPPPPGSPSRRLEEEERDVDSVLDRTVLKIATEMLDDIPAGDPRWKQRPGGPHTNIALGSSAALQIAAQLRDKQRAFSLFVDFIRSAGLWTRLLYVSRETGGGVVTTQCALGALAEQLAIAITLRKLQQGNDAQLIDAAIYQVVCGDNSEVEEEPEVEAALSSGALSPADACYRRVSRISRVLRALAAAAAHADAKQAAAHAARTIHVITAVLTEVHKVRSQWQSRSVPPVLGPRALLPALAELHKRAITQCGRNCPDPTLRAQVYEAAASLADLILTDAQHLQLSTHTQHVYERMRREAIQPFIEEGQTERAAALAEKFKDFELLIEMCVKNDDLERLYSYIDKYSNEGIAEATFAWLTEHGGSTSARLVRSLGARYPQRLAAWLAAAQQRQPLLALHHLAARDHAQAAASLARMASEETESVNRMATMASLGKLCLLASNEDAASTATWREISSRLQLYEQHLALPRDIRIRHGVDAADTRVMPAEDLVQMYIESESKALTEYDFKKALDLTDFVSDMERRDDLRLRIWCACIKRDDWSSCRVDAPAEELTDKMFFRLVDLVHVMGGDLELLLPPVEDIMTAPELAELVSDPRFHFIIKYGYECVDTTRNDATMET